MVLKVRKTLVEKVFQFLIVDLYFRLDQCWRDPDQIQVNLIIFTMECGFQLVVADAGILLKFFPNFLRLFIKAI